MGQGYGIILTLQRSPSMVGGEDGGRVRAGAEGHSLGIQLGWFRADSGWN